MSRAGEWLRTRIAAWFAAIRSAARPFYLVVTNQRLIFVNNLRGRVGTIAAAVPRSAVTVEPLRPHLLTVSMTVTINGTPQRFSWGRAQASMARRVADALNSASSAPAA